MYYNVIYFCLERFIKLKEHQTNLVFGNQKQENYLFDVFSFL